MADYRLTPEADEDLIAVALTGLAMFGEAQVDRYHDELYSVFETIAAHPQIARERAEVTPSVRVHPHRAHIVIYRVEPTGDVVILRVRHAREEWQADLR